MNRERRWQRISSRFRETEYRWQAADDPCAGTDEPCTDGGRSGLRIGYVGNRTERKVASCIEDLDRGAELGAKAAGGEAEGIVTVSHDVAQGADCSYGALLVC